jgi:hypothetical protein
VLMRRLERQAADGFSVLDTAQANLVSALSQFTLWMFMYLGTSPVFEPMTSLSGNPLIH